MATCPNCFGPLTDDHKCRRTSVFSRLSDALGTIAVGALAGWLLVVALDDRAAGALVVAAAALGAVLATAIRQAISGPMR